MKEHRGTWKKLPSDTLIKTYWEKNRQPYICGVNTATLFTVLPAYVLKVANTSSRGFLLYQINTKNQWIYIYSVHVESFEQN